MVVDEVLIIVTSLADQMTGSDGRVWGDVPADSPGDRILRYVDLAESGALQTLPAVNADLARQIETQFVGAMGRQIEGASGG